MTAHRVCPVGDLPPGEVRIVEVEGRSIGVFNVHGRFHALRNVCPHKLAPLCLGPITGVATADRPGEVTLERAGEVVRCPWHGWEFDIITGRSVFNPHRVRVKTYPVIVEEPPDPAIETFPVTVDTGWVVLHV